MKPFIEQAQGYNEYQEKALSRYCHMVGIPLIALSLMILLGFVHVLIPGILDVNLAEIATLVLLIYYFRLQWRMALIITPILVVLLWIAQFFSYDGPSSFSLWSFIVILLVGAALQFTGYFLAGKRPTFIDSLWQVLVAPLCLVAEAIFMAGRMQGLMEAIHGKKKDDAGRGKKAPKK